MCIRDSGFHSSTAVCKYDAGTMPLLQFEGENKEYVSKNKICSVLPPASNICWKTTVLPTTYVGCWTNDGPSYNIQGVPKKMGINNLVWLNYDLVQLIREAINLRCKGTFLLVALVPFWYIPSSSNSSFLVHS